MSAFPRKWTLTAAVAECPLRATSGSRNERSEAAGAIAEAVIRSVELIVQPDADEVALKVCR
jgi:hypothetical protein